MAICTACFCPQSLFVLSFFVLIHFSSYLFLSSFSFCPLCFCPQSLYVLSLYVLNHFLSCLFSSSFLLCPVSFRPRFTICPQYYPEPLEMTQTSPATSPVIVESQNGSVSDLARVHCREGKLNVQPGSTMSPCIQ